MSSHSDVDAMNLLAWSMMKEGPVARYPGLADTLPLRQFCEVLRSLGCTVWREADVVCVDACKVQSVLHYEVVRALPAAWFAIGPLIVRRRFVRAAIPGGWALRPHRLDGELRGLRCLGVRTSVDGGYVVAEVTEKLVAARVRMTQPTTLAAANVACVATMAVGRTVIEADSDFPNSSGLAKAISSMGINMTIGRRRLVVHGGPQVR
jgi:UDP-N-acetylglucosamine 1-carboxyvinyltransferase